MVAEAFRRNFKIKNIYKSTKIDPWFLEQIFDLVKIEKKLRKEWRFLKTLRNFPI